MSEDLYSQSNHRSGSPIIAAGAVVYVFTTHCDFVSAARTLLLHPSHLKPVPKETLYSSPGILVPVMKTLVFWFVLKLIMARICIVSGDRWYLHNKCVCLIYN